MRRLALSRRSEAVRRDDAGDNEALSMSEAGEDPSGVSLGANVLQM